jgi:hypothetical protein|tara:strand:- start:292 stop:498 length:207 start_codon:yes stop_codon:yes gene_type:complete
MGFLFGVIFGWFFCRLLIGVSPTFDRLLVWDNNVFAWRIVPEGTKLVRGKRYLAAAEVEPEEEKNEKA